VKEPKEIAGCEWGTGNHLMLVLSQ
jgi:hypothetical protein